ncbi:MAG: hypothetical protein PHH54_02695 [Candidatus Nanoarchaeia archaeon]|nr:hypothetical protein [Candidatus Nanoarchaeia archaeon]MDD5740869.1 hypothetical protein [Candidatus Nanoarchaeia archaeon]
MDEKERSDLVKTITESIEKYNDLPEEERNFMQLQNDSVVLGYMYGLWKSGAYAIYRRINGNLVPCL